MKKYPMLINGEQVVAQDDTWIASTNPYTLQDHGQIPRGKKIDADLAVESAYNAFHSDEWQSLTASSRGKLLRKIGDLISENIDELATLEVQDNGKLLSEMRAQVQYLPEYFYYYGGLADKIEGGIIPVEKADMQVHKKYEPLGVCVAITAWNSPLMLACWKIAPALAAGNTVVIKPSEYTSISTLVFANLFEKAGFPKGVVNVVTGYGSEIGEVLISHPKVAKVAFTGSEMGGKAVGQKATSMCKHVTLELGGKSPNIVFADANIDNAVKGAIAGIFAASGQTCIAGSRLLVEESIHDQFVQKLVEFAKRAKRGDPMRSDTNVGPIANKMQYDKVLS